jgi:hypothetical protein
MKRGMKGPPLVLHGIDTFYCVFSTFPGGKQVCEAAGAAGSVWRSNAAAYGRVKKENEC